MRMLNIRFTVHGSRFTGYTLIELLVAISILGIIFTIGFAGYREFSRRQELTGSVKKVMADLRLAQQLALTGQKPNGLVCTRLNSYTFVRTTATSYNLVANCSNADQIFKTVDLPENVNLSDGSVAFKSLGQGTNLEETLTFVVSNPISGTSGSITVGTGGNIE